MTGFHRHPTKRCDTCEFWARGDQWRFNKEQHVDDREAICRRNAPRATAGEFEYKVLDLLSTIAWDTASAEARDDIEKNWEEAHLKLSSWPSTTGADWCGEWRQKDYVDVDNEDAA